MNNEYEHEYELLNVVVMILKPSNELKYLIDILKTQFPNALTVHEHHNHNVDKSSTIKLESEFELDDYKTYLLALDSKTLEYKPLVNLKKYESKDKFIIWYEGDHFCHNLLELVMYSTLIKTLEFGTPPLKVVQYNNRDSISSANRHYYIQI